MVIILVTCWDGQRPETRRKVSNISSVFILLYLDFGVLVGPPWLIETFRTVAFRLSSELRSQRKGQPETRRGLRVRGLAGPVCRPVSK